MQTVLCYLLVFVLNCVLVSSSISTPLKDDDRLRIFKEPNEFEYVLKRQGIEGRSDEPDSKERRSSMGSSFIRFGRSQAAESNNDVSGDADFKVSRHPRWKSPDIVIRFGRSNLNTERFLKRGRNSQNFIRFGRSMQILPLDLDIATICSEILDEEENLHVDLRLKMTALYHLCNLLYNIEDDHRNGMDLADSKHE